jgi:hypothetical protein
MKKILTLNILAIFLILPLCSAAHYIVGIVENAKDGTNADGHSILLWNPTVGINDNLSDVIGPLGNSNTNNIYMIDCELLTNGCDVGNTLSLKIINNGDNYVSEERNVTVSGFGYDIAGNITLNSPPNISSVNVDDDLTIPPNEIDLVPANTKEITCSAIVTEYDGENSLINATGRFFDNVLSNYGASDDNNLHYTNNSCFINYSYGNSYEIETSCKFYVWYYANSQNWNCTIDVNDNLSIHSRKGDISFINPLLALGLDSFIDFNLVNGQDVSNESKFNVTNYGNVKINLSLNGYGFTENDGNAMNCSRGEIKNISINYEKFNLTLSNGGSMNLSEFGAKYVNLTSSPTVKKFNLDYRKNDLVNDAINLTYWRIYVPRGVSGDCQGNIIFGAVQAPGS